MLRYLKLLIIIPIAALIIGLAVINRGPVALNYLPTQLGGGSISMPAFVALFAALLVGVLIGGTAAWMAQGGHRRAERQFRREAERLKSEADKLRSAQPQGSGLALPALKR